MNYKKWDHLHFRSPSEQVEKFDVAIEGEFPTRSAALNELVRRYIREREEKKQ